MSRYNAAKKAMERSVDDVRRIPELTSEQLRELFSEAVAADDEMKEGDRPRGRVRQKLEDKVGLGCTRMGRKCLAGTGNGGVILGSDPAT